MKRQVFLFVGWILVLIGTLTALDRGGTGAIAIAGAILLATECIATVIVMSSSNFR